MSSTIVISIISVCIAVSSFIFGMYQYLIKNKKEDTASMTVVITKLEIIEESTRKIESSVEDLKREVKADHDTLIKLESSVHAAWKAIDDLKEVTASIR